MDKDLSLVEESPLSLSQNVLRNLENYEDFLSYYVQLEQATTAVSWLKADLLAELKKRQGDKGLEMISSDIKQPRSTVINYVRTARAFPSAQRSTNASFSAHMVASFADSYDDKEGVFLTDTRFEWIEKASDENISTRKLIEAIKLDKQTGSGSIPVVCRECGKVEGDVLRYSVYCAGKRGHDTFDLHEVCYQKIMSIEDHGKES